MGILAVILAILGLLVGFIGTVFFGNTAAIIAIALSVLAGVLGFLKRKKEGKGGIAAIVIGVLAIILAIIMMTSTQTLVRTLKDEIVKASGDEYQIARKYADQADTNTGFYGFISSLVLKAPEEEQEQLSKELGDVLKLLNESLDGNQAKVEEKVDDAKEKIEEQAGEAEEKVNEVIEDAGEKTEEIIEQVAPDGGNT